MEAKAVDESDAAAKPSVAAAEPTAADAAAPEPTASTDTAPLLPSPAAVAAHVFVSRCEETDGDVPASLCGFIRMYRAVVRTLIVPLIREQYATEQAALAAAAATAAPVPATDGPEASSGAVEAAAPAATTPVWLPVCVCHLVVFPLSLVCVGCTAHSTAVFFEPRDSPAL